MMDQADFDYMALDMTRHIRLSDNNPEAIWFWKGLLAGLLEWGIVDKPSFDRLLALLPEGPEDQIMRKIFHLD